LCNALNTSGKLKEIGGPVRVKNWLLNAPRFV